MLRSLLYAFGLRYLFRRMGGSRSYGYGGYGRSRPFRRRW